MAVLKITWSIEGSPIPDDYPPTSGAVATLSWAGKSQELEKVSVEPAGRTYWLFVGRGRSIDTKKLSNVTALGVAEGEGKAGPAGGEQEGEPAFLLRDDLNADNVGDFTYYELLGFDKYGKGSSEENVKKAYRKAVLKYHPDKATNCEEGEEDEVFIRMQKAFDTLMDITKRRAYDSSLEFDDTIPTTDACSNGQDFYKIYGPVFERNERFAVILPAPALGDDDAPIEEVYKFYEYWSSFESWRDFTHEAAEHDLEDAEDRYQKRMMEKENAKKVKLLKNKEYRRLSVLVDNARASDPRLRRAKLAEAESKRAKKEARIQEHKNREQEEARKIAEAEQRRLDEEERVKAEAKEAKAAKELVKKEMRRLKKVLRTEFPIALEREGGGADGLCNADLEFLCDYGDVDALTAGAAALSDSANCMESLAAVIRQVKAGQAEAASAMEKLKADEAARNAAILAKEQETKKLRQRPWSDEAMSVLAKAASRFPAGAQNRWQNIADYIAHLLPAEGNRTKEECIAKYQEISLAPAAIKRPVKAADGATPLAPPAAHHVVGTASNGTAAAPEGGEGGDAQTTSEVEDVWTLDQQKALEAALREFPATLEKNERWKCIADKVGGKSRKQCVERFKWVKAQLIARRQQTTPSTAS